MGVDIHRECHKLGKVGSGAQERGLNADLGITGAGDRECDRKR